jgi:hypothetical protein
MCIGGVCDQEPRQDQLCEPERLRRTKLQEQEPQPR